MKINKTATLVVAFIVVLIFAVYSANSEAENSPRIALGYSVGNSQLPWGELGYEYNNWEVAVAQWGEGTTDKGSQDTVEVVSLSHVVRPHWNFLYGRNYYRIGVAHVNDSVLVGDTNFRLGIGLEWEHVQLEYFHYSSAGIHDTNTGIDGIQLRLKLPNP